jgi:hypothetical protein
MVTEAVSETRAVTRHPADDPQVRAALAAIVADFVDLFLPAEPAEEVADHANDWDSEAETPASPCG